MADYDAGNALRVPREGAAGMWDRWENLTKDRNFLATLAGMGTKLGAGGVGEMIGAPLLQNIQSMAMQDAIKKAEAERSKWNEAIYKLMQGGGFTPAGVPGPREVKTDGEKTTLIIDTGAPKGVPTVENPTGAPTGAQGQTQRQDSAPQLQMPGGQTQQIPTPKMNLADILGFWSTPSR